MSNATFSYNGASFVEGEKSHMDGEQAMAFIRSRKSGAGGDFGRQERQQLVMQVANKLTSTNLLHTLRYLDHSKDNVTTDLSLGDLTKIRNKYKDANETVNRNQLDGQGGIQDDGLYYFIPSESSLSDIQNKIKDNLEIAARGWDVIDLSSLISYCQY